MANTDEFNGDGNKELTTEEMNKRVETEKAKITKSHGGAEEAPIESQPLATEETTTTSKGDTHSSSSTQGDNPRPSSFGTNK